MALDPTSFRLKTETSAVVVSGKAKSGYTPAVGDVVKFNSSGTIEKVGGATDRPFVVLTVNGNSDAGYWLTVLDTGVIYKNDGDDFTAGQVYYSDGSGGYTTSAPGSGYMIGTAISSREMLVKVMLI